MHIAQAVKSTLGFKFSAQICVFCLNFYFLLSFAKFPTSFLALVMPLYSSISLSLHCSMSIYVATFSTTSTTVLPRLLFTSFYYFACHSLCFDHRSSALITILPSPLITFTMTGSTLSDFCLSHYHYLSALLPPSHYYHYYYQYYYYH